MRALMPGALVMQQYVQPWRVCDNLWCVTMVSLDDWSIRAVIPSNAERQGRVHIYKAAMQGSRMLALDGV
jgi:hypothetical protein